VGAGAYRPQRLLPPDAPGRAGMAAGGLRVSWFEFAPSLAERIGAADLVISHAGAGSVFEALSAGKALVAVPNAALMANHQARAWPWDSAPSERWRLPAWRPSAGVVESAGVMECALVLPTPLFACHEHPTPCTEAARSYLPYCTVPACSTRQPIGPAPLDIAARRSAREARQELLARALPGPAPLADSLACLDRACAQHAEPQVLRCGILF